MVILILCTMSCTYAQTINYIIRTFLYGRTLYDNKKQRYSSQPPLFKFQ